MNNHENEVTHENATILQKGALEEEQLEQVTGAGGCCGKLNIDNSPSQHNTPVPRSPEAFPLPAAPALSDAQIAERLAKIRAGIK